MLTPTEKADVLIEALGWIRQFRDKVTVIKLGGSLLDDVDALRHLLVDLTGNTMVVGTSTAFAGGTTQANGTSTTAVRNANAVATGGCACTTALASGRAW